MPLTEDVLQVLSEASDLEEVGRYDLAEIKYLQTLKEIDQSDKLFRGNININLGINAAKDRRLDKAIKGRVSGLES